MHSFIPTGGVLLLMKESTFTALQKDGGQGKATHLAKTNNIHMLSHSSSIEHRLFQRTSSKPHSKDSRLGLVQSFFRPCEELAE